MTIGPEPMIRIFLMSFRRGTFQWSFQWRKTLRDLGADHVPVNRIGLSFSVLNFARPARTVFADGLGNLRVAFKKGGRNQQPNSWKGAVQDWILPSFLNLRSTPKTAKRTANSQWRKKARKIWSRLTAFPRRSRTPQGNVRNECPDCLSQAALSQFWSKLSASFRLP